MYKKIFEFHAVKGNIDNYKINFSQILFVTLFGNIITESLKFTGNFATLQFMTDYYKNFERLFHMWEISVDIVFLRYIKAGNPFIKAQCKNILACLIFSLSLYNGPSNEFNSIESEYIIPFVQSFLF